MQSIIIDQHGTPEVLQIRRVSTPLIEPHEVLVKVRAAGLNPVDCAVRQGVMKNMLPMKFPAILGYDIAGEVAGTGMEVKNFEAGDEVFAMLPMADMGAYAHYVAVHEDDLALKPKNLSFEAAAAIPLAGLTALQALRDKGGLLDGHKEVLINGASGGVGTMAVQIAKAMGATVVGVCSTNNLEMVRKLGADVVIDYHKQDFTQLAAQYDIVFDAVGKSTFADCKAVLKKHGVYVSTAVSPKLLMSVGTSLISSKKASFISVSPSGDDLRLLSNFAEENLLQPVVEKIYLPIDMPAAHQQLERGHVAGKLVVKMAFED